MTIDEICSACIDALRAEGYNESTIFNYEDVIRRFKQFCKTITPQRMGISGIPIVNPSSEKPVKCGIPCAKWIASIPIITYTKAHHMTWKRLAVKSRRKSVISVNIR